MSIYVHLFIVTIFIVRDHLSASYNYSIYLQIVFLFYNMSIFLYSQYLIFGGGGYNNAQPAELYFGFFTRQSALSGNDQSAKARNQNSTAVAAGI